jgi:hypothetical protein
MATSTTITYTASAHEIVLASNRTIGVANINLDDFATREPVAHVALLEFLNNGLASGTVTLTAA